MAREKTPWYRWQVNVGVLYLTIVLGWAAWEAFAGVPGPRSGRVVAVVMLGGLAAVFAWTLWCDREPWRNRFGIDLDRPDSDDEAASTDR